jgi:hypothetical protein
MKTGHTLLLALYLALTGAVIYKNHWDAEQTAKEHDAALERVFAEGQASKVCPPQQEPTIEQCMVMWFGHKPTDFATSRQRICGK